MSKKFELIAKTFQGVEEELATEIEALGGEDIEIGRRMVSFKGDKELMYKANVAVGWLSPLNHATYHMHNFGYDLLPRLWQTYLIFGILIALCFFLSLRAIRKYNFNFVGTEG